ncbi:GlsB/YeaQ/YmgE family stress response membrane protein [Agrobacterium pusense]|uniref:GlsB/YeaQ/YmgE family stress response membrane protein n=1 Tax=Agrobacterium pusense TaxID=648995 RepID=UPI003D0EE0C4
MESAGIGWIAAIFIGGVAGWLAEQVMKSNMGVFMNILLGIVGAVIANAILAVFGIVMTGWLGYLIAGFIGACILIAIGRAFRRG